MDSDLWSRPPNRFIQRLLSLSFLLKIRFCPSVVNSSSARIPRTQNGNSESWSSIHSRCFDCFLNENGWRHTISNLSSLMVLCRPKGWVSSVKLLAFFRRPPTRDTKLIQSRDFEFTIKYHNVTMCNLGYHYYDLLYRIPGWRTYWLTGSAWTASYLHVHVLL